MAPQQQVYSIKEITQYIRLKLEGDQLLGDVWVRGEISNFTHHSSGHMYFTLKDKFSRIKAIMFASHNQRLPFLPKEGAKVLARGNVGVYERDGNYQFYVTQMQPDGLGSLYLAFEQLKAKLEAEGLFAEARKRPIPLYPTAVGVVTSPTGAAIRDIVTTLQRRYPAAAIKLYPAIVQGSAAPGSIIKGIEALNAMDEVDVIIVGRGGGSLEELWAFNEEAVARCIAASSIPVISAVGHETDYTIADFTADLRAATPTAAAELAVPHAGELRRHLGKQQRLLQQALLHMSRQRQERLARLQRSPAFLYPLRIVSGPAERLDRLSDRLVRAADRQAERSLVRLKTAQMRLQRYHPGEQAGYARMRLESASKQLQSHAAGQLRSSRLKLASMLRSLDALSPLKVMARGYSVVFDENAQHIINSATQAEPGDRIRVKFADGQFLCEILEKKGGEE